MARLQSKLALAGAVGLVALFASDTVSPTDSYSLVSQAEARVGRPLTPVSVAGVARRQTRRAVAVGTAAAVGTRCYMTQNGRVCN